MLIFDHKGRTRFEYWYIVTRIAEGGDLSVQTQNLMIREQLIHCSPDAEAVEIMIRMKDIKEVRAFKRPAGSVRRRRWYPQEPAEARREGNRSAMVC